MTISINEQEFFKRVEKSKRRFFKKYFVKNKNIDDVIFKLTKKIFIVLGKSAFFINNLVNALEKLEKNKNKKEEQEKLIFYIQIYNKIYYLIDLAIQEFESIVDKLESKKTD